MEHNRHTKLAILTAFLLLVAAIALVSFGEIFLGCVVALIIWMHARVSVLENRASVARWETRDLRVPPARQAQPGPEGEGDYR